MRRVAVLVMLAALRAPAAAEPDDRGRAEPDAGRAAANRAAANRGAVRAADDRADRLAGRAAAPAATNRGAVRAADGRADRVAGRAASPAADARGPHLYAGLFASAYLVAAQATDYRRGYLDHGAGGGILAGVRLSRRFSVDAAWRTTANRDDLDGARVTNIPLAAMVVSSVTAGPRLHWPTRAVEPYARLGLGYAAILTDFVDCPDCDAVFARGPAAELGAGLDVRLGRHVTAGLRASGQLMRFAGDSFEKRFRQADVEPPRSSTTILSLATDAGVALHF